MFSRLAACSQADDAERRGLRTDGDRGHEGFQISKPWPVQKILDSES
jgi:hypothetical protein